MKKKYKHLSGKERELISVLHAKQISISEIARILKCSNDRQVSMQSATSKWGNFWNKVGKALGKAWNRLKEGWNSFIDGFRSEK